ncbi:MAG: hypothetical protein CMJ49_10175 [Planctomycetaceae bacterium]|nr:hypothetical protein [Planctomycetaceae bacterium]
MNLFFNYSIDCETPRDERFPNAAESWEVTEASTRGFVGLMDELGVRDGATLFVYPDVVTHQRALYRDMADAGIEVALHLNGLRYSRLTGDRAQWLGAMDYEQQRDALKWGKADLEDAIGRPCLGYRACYGSANDATFAILEELGFRWASNASSRYRPEFHSTWWGSWRYPHHASGQSQLIPGDLKLYEIPLTVGITVCYEGNTDQPLDLRAEAPVELVGADRAAFRDIISENIVEMRRRHAPVRAIIAGSHNTRLFGETDAHERHNVASVVEHTRALADEHEMTFLAGSFAHITDFAKAVGSY